MEDTHWRYGIVYQDRPIFRPTFTLSDRREIRSDSKRNNVLKFMSLMTILFHYAQLFEEYGQYQRREEYHHDMVRVLAKQNYRVPWFEEYCLPHSATLKDKILRFSRHIFTIWTGTDLDGSYRVYVAIQNTTAEDVERGEEYDEVLHYGGIKYTSWRQIE